MNFGPTHADDLNYLFDMKDDKCELFETIDLEVAQRMTTLWANFAKVGNPNGNNVNKKLIWNEMIC